MDDYLGWIVEFESSLDFERRVRQFLRRICKDVNKSEKPRPKESSVLHKIGYEEVGGYLERAIAPLEKTASVGNSYYLHYKPADLVAIIIQESRVALLGDAGTGKTTELRRVAAHFSSAAAPFFPFLVRLNKYVNQKIEDFLPPNWHEVPKSQLLVLLDGLDEVEANNRNSAIRQIELFAEQNPECHIVVSCRSNFYKTELGGSSASLKDFHSYTLLNLSPSAISEYLTTNLRNRSQVFSQLIAHNGLWSLIELPFYLEQLVSLFVHDGSLPNSKAQLFERLIQDRIAYDIEHFRTTVSLNVDVDVVIGTLERIALSMEALGRNYISGAEYERIVGDGKLRTLVNHYSGWNKTEGEKEQWQFDHNNLQEYFAARALSRQELHTIQGFISFAPEHKRLFPSWVNTLAFLVSLLDANGQLFRDLITWILESQPEVVVKFERDKIDTATRISLFKKIFEYYKIRQIPIDRDKFDYSELARFGQSDESIDFLMAEATNAQDGRTLANAVQLLGDSEIPRTHRQAVTKTLLDIALSVNVEDYVRNRALIALADTNLNSKEVVNEIVPALRSSDNQWIRFGLYYFLYSSDCLDENIEVFFEGLKYVGIYSERLFDEQWHLVKGLERATSPKAVKQILAYLKDHVSEIEQYSFENTIDAIANNAAVAYQEDPSLLDLAVDLTAALRRHRIRANSGGFLTFFELTNTKLAAFQRVLANRKSYRDPFSLLAQLATPECLAYFVQQYKDRNVTNDEVWSFQFNLGWAGTNLYEAFNQLINKESDNKFPIPPPKVTEKKEPTINDIDLLFNRESFIEEVRRIFDIGNKETLSKEDVFEITKDQWESPTFSYLAITTLSNISEKQAVAFETAATIITSWDWELFRVSVLYERLSNNQDLILSDDQRAIVADWCETHLIEIDFKTALVTKNKGQGSTSWIALYLWFFLRRLDLKYPKAVLLDMLSFDWIDGHQFLGIEYLESRLSRHEIVERVLDNLDHTIEHDNVLVNHLRFCERYSIKEVLPFALTEMRNPNRSEHVRTIALEIIGKLSDEINTLEEELSFITDDFKWKLVDRLVELRSGQVQDVLLKLLNTEDEREQFKAALHLITLQHIKGLEFYVSWIKQHKEFAERENAGGILRKLHTSESIPFLMELLQIGYERELSQDQFHTLDRAALDALNTVAMQSWDNYYQVRDSIQAFIDKNLSTLKHVNFLYQYLDSLERSFYLNRSTQFSLDEVIQKVNAALN